METNQVVEKARALSKGAGLSGYLSFVIASAALRSMTNEQCKTANGKWYYLIIPCVAMYSSPEATVPSNIFNFRSDR